MLLNVLGCRLTYWGQAETKTEAWFSIALRPRKPEGSLGRTAQDGHLDSHTAPELCAHYVQRPALLIIPGSSYLEPAPSFCPSCYLCLFPPLQVFLKNLSLFKNSGVCVCARARARVRAYVRACVCVCVCV